MDNKELNIKSSTIEKGLDLAKDFLGKLISPTVEEVGLLVSDNIKFLRFKNQVRILLKAKQYVEERNIKVGEIPVKILVPLLEHASLEENETLQEKWSRMIANMADSDTTLHNQIFPYILSQISIQEFDGLQDIEKTHLEFRIKLAESALSPNIKNTYSEEYKESKRIEHALTHGFGSTLEEFEIANLLRLGLIKQLPPEIYIPEFSTGGSDYPNREEWHYLDIKYGDDGGYVLTELGRMFLKVCL